MSQDSISSELEKGLLGCPTAQELEQKISEAQAVHQTLLNYSEQVNTLILPEEEMPRKRQQAPTATIQQPTTSQQAQNIPLPPPTWTEEEKNTLLKNISYFEK